MKEITKAQQEILQILWEIGEGVVNDIIDRLPNPKPAYNTVSTVVRVLEKKGYVGHKAIGKTHIYYPLVKEGEFAKHQLKGFLKNHFGNSIKKMVTFFANEEKISLNELEDLRKLVEQEIKKQKNA